MTNDELVGHIKRKRSFLCVGLDTDLEKVPPHLLDTEDPIFTFNKAIIDATQAYCVAYKPNIAFYEAYGLEGWKSLERTMAYLNENYPDQFTIADAKRGDIGNTSLRYAKAFFETLDFDSITIAPYMGKDSVEPFLTYTDKHAILLALTSNQGAFDFQMEAGSGAELYKKVLRVSTAYAGAERLMYVVGATKADYLREVRKIVPEHFLLVPGVGAQGGSLEEVCHNGMNDQVGLLVNSSRGIIYASNGTDFAEAAATKAKALQNAMAKEMDAYFGA
ncbi:orotidine-5'-phosphate decarboxylase [Flagellimonas sp. DF-77]|uniref:orotidine-5'-phosphate decarboxylase n=1 Tax=Flagellimonas algarum TaxID=3230298 RepID=UPI00339B6FD6